MDSPPLIEAKGLSKTYGHGKTGVHVLRGLDLRLSAGELTVLLGPSGSGKSTLLNLLGLMDRPTAGDVCFAGRSTSRMDELERAALRNARLGFVFQFDSLLPEFTVLENATMPARIALARGAADGKARQPWSDSKFEALRGAEARALELLAGLGLRNLKDRFPAQISGGERQRVALCRALINRPAAVLADEPTGNLDKHNGELVFKDLKGLAQAHGVAVLMATHNEAARAYATRVLHMSDGTIREDPSA